MIGHVHWSREERVWVVRSDKKILKMHWFTLVRGHTEINERGLERIRCGGKRFPCAFLVGEVKPIRPLPFGELVAVSFHPLKSKDFMAGGQPLITFDTAFLMDSGKVLVQNPA